MNVFQEIRVSSETGNYSQIPADCLQPSDPDDIRVHEMITVMMKLSDIQSVWLPVVRINHTKWTWMDGTIYGTNLIKR